MQAYDAVVVGAGAAGLFCAGLAGQRGARVLLIDHAAKVAEKIRISGGGRCNFTNRDVGPGQFLSANPDFCRSALAGYRPQDFIDLLQRHDIAWHEKHKGQKFCDRSSEDIIAMLLRECDLGGVTRWQPCSVQAVRRSADGFEVDTDRGPVAAPTLVVATGGLPIPQIGASDFGLRLARQFDHRIVDTRPALVPLVFDPAGWSTLVGLAGLSLEVALETGSKAPSVKRASGNKPAGGAFVEDLLFTHRGLSGPAVLQISSFWRPGEAIRIDLAPGRDVATALSTAKKTSKRKLANELGDMLPRRLADAWLADRGDLAERILPDLRDKDLARLAQDIACWSVVPTGTEGYRKAEVMAGGVDTRDLDSKTLESRVVPGLHFIGEVVDVTGWLGGYNFQWAWASAAACARAIAK